MNVEVLSITIVAVRFSVLCFWILFAKDFSLVVTDRE